MSYAKDLSILFVALGNFALSGKIIEESSLLALDKISAMHANFIFDARPSS